LIAGIPVIQASTTWLETIDKRTQFIVAVEVQQSDVR
jgi:hypothetical protein